MEKDWPKQDEPALPPRPSLAEEQRRAFEEDRKRQRKPILSLRFSGHLFRN